VHLQSKISNEIGNIFFRLLPDKSGGADKVHSGSCSLKVKPEEEINNFTNTLDV
jgi:hypothetical protein